MTDLDSIKQTLVGISKGDTILDTLLEFERTLDNAEIFALHQGHFNVRKILQHKTQFGRHLPHSLRRRINHP